MFLLLLGFPVSAAPGQQESLERVATCFRKEAARFVDQLLSTSHISGLCRLGRATQREDDPRQPA
jgi:hypothetical protein